jgi:hypothetical protein
MKILSLTIFFIYTSTLFAGGPWLNKKGSGFFQIQSTFPTSAYSILFLENGKELNLQRPVLDFTYQAYLEYGISNKFDIIASLPYKIVSTQAVSKNAFASDTLPNGSINGLGNSKFGLKYQLMNKGLKLATSIQTSFNTVRQDLEKGLITGYAANSIGFYMHMGKGFNKNLYSFLDIGVNKMSNNFSPYLEMHYELGYQVKPSFWTAFTLDLRDSFYGGTYTNSNLKQTGLYTNNQEYFAFGIKASYELKNKIGFTAATFGAFSGNYVAKISTFSIGIYKKW